MMGNAPAHTVVATAFCPFCAILGVDSEMTINTQKTPAMRLKAKCSACGSWATAGKNPTYQIQVEFMKGTAANDNEETSTTTGEEATNEGDQETYKGQNHPENFDFSQEEAQKSGATAEDNQESAGAAPAEARSGETAEGDGSDDRAANDNATRKLTLTERRRARKH